MSDKYTYLRGSNNHGWKGDQAGYSAIHYWISRHYGKANKCEECVTNYKSKRFHWANISGEYKRDRKDYKMLCPSHHKIFDNGKYCGKGHEFTEDNTYISPKSGKRRCKECIRIQYKNYYIKVRDR